MLPVEILEIKKKVFNTFLGNGMIERQSNSTCFLANYERKLNTSIFPSDPITNPYCEQ
jgi:hypothetical protein